MTAEAMKAFQQFSDIFRVYAQVGGVAQPNATTMQQMQSLFLNWSDTIYQVIQHFWQPKKAYVLGQVVWTPSMPAGAIAVCTKAGTTNGTEPTWPTIMGATVNDGGVTWKIVEEAPETLPADGGTADLAKNAEKFGGQLPAYYATASELAKRAPINNPAFTGNPTAPTAAAGTSNTQIATTQFVMNAIAEISSQGKIVSYNLAQNGYCKWDIGLILQWCVHWPNSQNYYAAFSMPFSSSCYVAVPNSRAYDNAYNMNVALYNFSNKGLYIMAGQGERAKGIDIIAIGR